jgi:hypothetical protein
MSGPAVTIVIPTFNRVEWLRGAIDSVLAQDYDDLELLVVDDGSTDGTPELVSLFERHHQGRFRAIAQANAGQATAINRGWDLARGELVGYLADDDLFAQPGAVSRLVAELIADPGCVVAYPGYHLIDADGAILDTIRPIEYSPLDAVRLHDTVIGPGALIRREAVAATGGWDPGLRWIGDLILWLRLAGHGSLRRVDEPLASWRRHAEGATSQVGLDHAREHVRVADLGVELLGGTDALKRADRAEALRNACILGSFFGGDPADAPASRWATIDLQRPTISAYGAGMQWNELPDERADVATKLWRELARKATELAALRTPDAPRPGGLDAARELLRHAGLVAAATGEEGPASATREVRTAMLKAAWHCSADCDAERTRYLLVDSSDGAVTPAEFDELSYLGTHPWHDDVRAAIARRADELERLSAQR